MFTFIEATIVVPFAPSATAIVTFSALPVTTISTAFSTATVLTVPCIFSSAFAPSPL